MLVGVYIRSIKEIFLLTFQKQRVIGSPIQQNIGESIRNHGFGTYDFGTKEYTYTDLENPKPFLKFSIKSFSDIENGVEKLVNL